MRSFMNLTILPFGKARVDNVSAPVPHFTCQHGTNECMGNMIETCVVHVVKGAADRRQDLGLHVPELPAAPGRTEVRRKHGHKVVPGSTVRDQRGEPATSWRPGLQTWKIQSYVARVPLVVVDGERWTTTSSTTPKRIS
ncbi:hypothetical protein MTO96_004836 [Rhipicephalus appendiculatus]